ncbi:MAG: hypothetical protein KAW41_06030 [Candidatus Diapherotrites archaeon]|nr:hypothetical protein [Candidatus Diapherotrites archaeon]
MPVPKKKNSGPLTSQDVAQTVRRVIREENPNPVSAHEVSDIVRKVIRGESLKEELWRDAVKEGVETAIWDISGYAIITMFLLMVTGIILAASVFAVLIYLMIGTAL